MVINTNVAAARTANNLNVSQTNLAKSLSRLSSGSRIVNPSDDAAGLAVSSRLRAQIKRLDSALSNVIKYFSDEDNSDLLNALLLESLKINKFNKKDFLNVSNKINNLIENIVLKTNLNKDEITSLKFLMFKRMGYGFNIASSLNFLPLPLFKIIFYLASPMYLISLRKFVLVMRRKIRALVSTLKNI